MIQVHLATEGDQTAFFPSSHVSGTVAISSSNPYILKSLEVTLWGREEAQLNSSHTLLPLFSLSQPLVSSPIVHQSHANKNETAQVFQFCIKIPNGEWSPSIKIDQCERKYGITATAKFKGDGILRSEKKITKKLSIDILRRPLYYWKEHLNPKLFTINKNISTCCISRGILNAFLALPKTIFIPGEAVPYKLVFSYMSLVPAKDITVALYRVIDKMADQRVKHKRTMLASTKFKISPTERSVSGMLSIPLSVLPSSTHNPSCLVERFELTAVFPLGFGKGTHKLNANLIVTIPDYESFNWIEPPYADDKIRHYDHLLKPRVTNTTSCAEFLLMMCIQGCFRALLFGFC